MYRPAASSPGVPAQRGPIRSHISYKCSSSREPTNASPISHLSIVRQSGFEVMEGIE